MNVLFVGGSNTVMTNGYIAALANTLKRSKGIQIDNLRNVAIGSNNCTHGVEIMAGLDYLAEIDLLFIEYAVNDIGCTTPEAWPTWQASTEGMVRMALSRRPDMSIVLVGLGRRPKNKKQRVVLDQKQAMLYAGMEAIAAHYAPQFDVRSINVDAHLRSIAPTDEAFAELYTDEAHYKRPEVSSQVGRYIADFVEPPAVKPGCYEMPAPLVPFAFDSAELVPLPQALAEKDAEALVFKNSRFTLNTAVLLPGRRYTVDLPGSLIALSFCASPDSSGLLVEEEGEAPFVMDTLHTAPRDKIFPFLIKQMPLNWKDWTREGVAEPRRLTLQPLTKDEYESAPGTYQRRYSMVPPTESEPKAYMHAALCYRPSSTTGPLGG